MLADIIIYMFKFAKMSCTSLIKDRFLNDHKYTSIYKIDYIYTGCPVKNTSWFLAHNFTFRPARSNALVSFEIKRFNACTYKFSNYLNIFST